MPAAKGSQAKGSKEGAAKPAAKPSPVQSSPTKIKGIPKPESAAIPAQGSEPNLAHDQIVQALSRSLERGMQGLGNVPDLLTEILRTGAWRMRTLAKTGECVTFTCFSAFVVTPPPNGLGASVRNLEQLCRDNLPALALLDQAVRNPQGGRRSRQAAVQQTAGSEGEQKTPFKNDNVQDDLRLAKTEGSKGPIVKAATGNSRRAALRRLADQRPDLYQRVLASEMTAHAAAQAAGFRSEVFSVPRNLVGLERALRRRLGEKELTELVRRLSRKTAPPEL